MTILNNKNKAFTLIEVLVSIAIFISISITVYAGFVSILKTTRIVKIKGVMTNIANEQFEILRNLPYQSVGLVNGIPSGVVEQSQSINRASNDFLIETIIRNFDDPFDGTFDGTSRDLSPADMKLVELTISCTSCESTLSPISFTTKISPKNLETASTNGALVIRVFDASGLAVAGASVHITNDTITPNIDLTDQTDINGLLTIVDAPPSTGGYHIVVTKDGYSTDQTYKEGESSNPTPIKPDASVLLQQITQISFAIDVLSTINILAINNQCVPTSNFSFDVSGDKLIGDPDVLKYDRSFTTDGSGLKSLSDIEWGTYNITGASSVNDIIGTNPLLSLGINPNTTQNLQIITAPKDGNRLVVVVRDQSTGLPITDATVSVSGPDGYSKTATTNEGYFSQTDWSDGDGQNIIGSESKYLDSDGNIDISTEGSLSLLNNGSSYSSSGYLTSSTIDTGSTSNFRQIIWSPISQPSGVGTSGVRFQIATNNDNLTWNFVGPDGTAATYFNQSNQNIDSSHNGHRYLRYRVYLSTADNLYSPSISDISFTYTSGCIPPGQVSFSKLQTGSYVVDIEKDGYQSVSRIIDISNSWTKTEFSITP